MTERLQLQAEMTDKASPAIKKLKAELDTINRTPGMEAATKWITEFATRAHDFAREGGGAAGVLNALGVGGLTAAASLAGLVEHFKGIATQTLQMKELGREVGLTVSQLNALNHAAQSFGLDSDKLQAGISNFAAQMPEFMRGYGHLHDELSKRFPGLTKELQGEGMADRLRSIFKFVGQPELQKDPQRQKQVLQDFFGGAADDMEKLFAKGPDAFFKAVDDWAGKLAPISEKQVQQAEALREATLKFNSELDDFNTRVGPAFLTAMATATKWLADFMDPDRKKDGEAQRKGGAEDERKRIGPQPTPEQEKKWLSEPRDASESFARYKAMEAELHKIQHDLEIDRTQHPVGYPARHGQDFQRIEELGRAMKALKEQMDKAWPDDKVSSRDDQNGGLFHTASFGGFEARQDGPLAAGVKAGVLAAFRELEAMRSAEGAAGGGDIQKASWGGGGLGGGGFGGGGGGSFDGKPYSGPKDSASVKEHVDFIRKAASALGIDPDIAVRVANSEGLHSFVGDRGTSFGDFQLHVKNNIPGLSLGGLGDVYRKQTGHDPRDPHNWREMDLFALKQAAKGGWGPWHGAAHIGVYGKRGIGPAPRDAHLPDTSPPPPFRAPPAPKPVDAKQQSVRAEIHVIDKGRNVGKTMLSMSEGMDGRLQRWPTMVSPSELG